LVSDGFRIYDSVCDEILEDDFFHNQWVAERL